MSFSGIWAWKITKVITVTLLFVYTKFNGSPPNTCCWHLHPYNHAATMLKTFKSIDSKVKNTCFMKVKGLKHICISQYKQHAKETQPRVHWTDEG